MLGYMIAPLHPGVGRLRRPRLALVREDPDAYGPRPHRRGRPHSRVDKGALVIPGLHAIQGERMAPARQIERIKVLDVRGLGGRGATATRGRWAA